MKSSVFDLSGHHAKWQAGFQQTCANFSWTLPDEWLTVICSCGPTIKPPTVIYLWVTFLAETSKDLEIILIIIVLRLVRERRFVKLSTIIMRISNLSREVQITSGNLTCKSFQCTYFQWWFLLPVIIIPPNLITSIF